ncbi:MAG: hypothetical protein MRY21_02050 [Simkaniaceae bacterium]|nr:hypothetical protein [Simkaniaceae bacterium]
MNEINCYKEGDYRQYFTGYGELRAKSCEGAVKLQRFMESVQLQAGCNRPFSALEKTSQHYLPIIKDVMRDEPLPVRVYHHQVRNILSGNHIALRTIAIALSILLTGGLATLFLVQAIDNEHDSHKIRKDILLQTTKCLIMERIDSAFEVIKDKGPITDLGEVEEMNVPNFDLRGNRVGSGVYNGLPFYVFNSHDGKIQVAIFAGNRQESVDFREQRGRSTYLDGIGLVQQTGDRETGKADAISYFLSDMIPDMREMI